MRRRRVPVRGEPGTVAVRRDASDLQYLEQVVSIRFPMAAAREYLARHLVNPIRVRLVDAQQGDVVGTVRSVEVVHLSGERTWVRAERRLADGAPAGAYAPAHLVTVHAQVEGARVRSLTASDEVVLHVASHSPMRFLPQVFHGEGPMRAGAEADPTLPRLLLMLQHVMSSVGDQIEGLPALTNPSEVDARLLPWLASWVGFDLDESLPAHQQRELVRRAIRLMRTRGTRAGIEEMVRVLTSAPVRIEERRPPAAMVLGRGHLGGGTLPERYAGGQSEGTYLSGPEPLPPTQFFTLRLEPRGRFAERFGERATQVLRRIVAIVSAERPSHLRFVVRFDELVP